MVKNLIFVFLFIQFTYCQTEIEINQPAQEIVFTKSFTKSLDSSALKGKFLVLEFWASWCKPCLEAVPHMNALQNSLKSDKLLFLSMTDEKSEKVVKALLKFKFETLVVNDTSNVTFENFKSKAFNDVIRPSVVLIDDTGIIQWVGHPKLLTKQILLDFMARKLKFYNYFTTNQFKKEMNDGDSNKKAIELFKERFSNQLADPTISTYLFLEKSTGIYKKKRTFDKSASAYLGIDTKIDNIYMLISGKSKNEFSFPQKFSNYGFDYCMINRNRDVLALEEELVKTFRLTKRTEVKEVENYDVFISDVKLLKPSFYDEKLLFKYVEDDENGTLKYKNYTLNELLEDLNNRLRMHFSTQINNTTIYEFEIEIDSHENLFKSLGKYGLGTVSSMKKIEYIVFDEKID